jgi:TolB protein
MVIKTERAQSFWYLFLAFMAAAALAACGPAEPAAPTSSALPAPTPAANVEAYPAPGYPAPGYPAPEEGSRLEAVEQDALPNFGGQIAFHSDRTGSLQIFTLNGDDGLIEQQYQASTQAFEPSWSPGCQALAFSSGAGGDDHFRLYTVEAGSDSAELLAEGSAIHYWAPAWSPTGDVIAYQNNQDQLMNVCFISSEGLDLGCLTRGTFSNAMPGWSADGSKLLFTSNRDGDWEIFVTDYPPTDQVVQLTNNEGIDFYPHFSPDGDKIVFAAKRNNNYDIFTMNADGSNEIQLTTDILDDTTPTWVGDDRIAFSSARTEDWELYLMNADGTDLNRLTYQTGVDQYPTWCSEN